MGWCRAAPCAQRRCLCTQIVGAQSSELLLRSPFPRDARRYRDISMRIVRRGFLQGLLTLGLSPTLPSVIACSSLGKPAAEDDEGGSTGGPTFGRLLPDPRRILELPTGFSYAVLDRFGDVMSDGHPVPGRPDGMACFAGPNGEYILLRNHELDVGPSPEALVAYDRNMTGGVSRLVIDGGNLRKISSNWVLTGTCRNCAGGPSPWGWLSCEETEDDGHGYVFLCDPTASRAVAPRRLTSFGRFKHEAAAVDPRSQMVYLTEDQADGAFYRHVPGGDPFQGTLQALKIRDAERFDLAEGNKVGSAFEVAWVTVADPEGVSSSTREQAHRAGAAFVKRGEGTWHHDGSIFFVSTSGGPVGLGQVFRLDPTTEGGRLTLIAQAEDNARLVNPDNITVAPGGDVFVSEDNLGPNRIRRIGPDGRVETFAKNVLSGGSSELCGVCFSPDGRVMFVNIQNPGVTLAIRGPFGASGKSA